LRADPSQRIDERLRLARRRSAAHDERDAVDEALCTGTVQPE
jgi:hypothetical protein